MEISEEKLNIEQENQNELSAREIGFLIASGNGGVVMGMLISHYTSGMLEIGIGAFYLITFVLAYIALAKVVVSND